jgi:hypothetical protein
MAKGFQEGMGVSRLLEAQMEILTAGKVGMDRIGVGDWHHDGRVITAHGA